MYVNSNLLRGNARGRRASASSPTAERASACPIRLAVPCAIAGGRVKAWGAHTASPTRCPSSISERREPETLRARSRQGDYGLRITVIPCKYFALATAAIPNGSDTRAFTTG